MSKLAQQAVVDYFDCLLSPQEGAIQALYQRSLEAHPDLQSEPAPKDAPDALVQPVATPEVAEPAQETPEPAPKRPEPTPEVPVMDASSNWREQLGAEFQCLYFHVGSLQLAVPLSLLGGIQRMEALNQLPGAPDWVLGVAPRTGQHLQVVDSQSWLAVGPSDAAMEYHYLIQLADSPWALACERLANAEPLRQSEVQWRQGQGSNRQHIAGIVREKRCVILDVSQTIALLNAGNEHKEPFAHELEH